MTDHGFARATDGQEFAELQAKLAPLFEKIFPDPSEPRTVLVIPALSLDKRVLAKIQGVQHYEERLLCMLMLLRMPRTRIVYVTSLPIASSIVDYYLQLLAGVPGAHARKRLTLLSAYDSSEDTITEKILARPRLLHRLQQAIGDPSIAHMSVFNVTEAERSLAVRLGIPIYGCDPALSDLGTKSGSRESFRKAGIAMPDGLERLRDADDMAEALTELKRRHPDLRKAVVKLEEGTSGEGNAVFRFQGCPDGPSLRGWVDAELPVRLAYEASDEEWGAFSAKYAELGGIVECWVEGAVKTSPSMQGRIDPLGRVEAISTHDQVMGGPSGQVFKGSTFPADEAYRLAIQDAGMAVGEVLKGSSVLGRFGVDFVSVQREGGWDHYAIEINLRKGGTTHTFRTLQFLTDGTYDPHTGLFLTQRGEPRFYYASDNLKSADYRKLTPPDLVDVAVENGIHFHGATEEGVVFHLIGAVAGHGKLGLVCVSKSPEGAQVLYRETVEILDREALRVP